MNIIVSNIFVIADYSARRWLVSEYLNSYPLLILGITTWLSRSQDSYSAKTLRLNSGFAASQPAGMFKGFKKPDRKGNQSGSTKVQKEETVDGHDGGYDPSETAVDSGSYKGPSTGQGHTADPKKSRIDKKSKSSGKLPDPDPTGHEGGYDPSTD